MRARRVVEVLGAMNDAKFLRARAEQCFRLAWSISDQEASEELEALGRDYERRADESEQAAASAPAGE